MRVRTTLFTACATAMLFAGMTSAASAEAGTGVSTVCSDGSFPTGGAEHVVMTSPLTIAIERGPGTIPSSLQICYSTASPGTDGQVTGGWIGTANFVSTAPPATFLTLRCRTDYQFGIAPECDSYAIAIADQADLATATIYPNYVCVVYLNGPCAVYSPGVTLQTDTTGAPTLYVDTFGNNVAVNPPGQCVALFVTPCP